MSRSTLGVLALTRLVGSFWFLPVVRLLMPPEPAVLEKCQLPRVAIVFNWPHIYMKTWLRKYWGVTGPEVMSCLNDNNSFLWYQINTKHLAT